MTSLVTIEAAWELCFPNTEELQAEVRALATLAESEAPILSCYIDVSSGRRTWESAFASRSAELRKAASGSERQLIDEALGTARDYLSGSVDASANGVAIFVRAGASPFARAIQFAAAVPTSVTVDTLPGIYHLMAHKDTFDRYLVVLSRTGVARVFEVQLGSVSQELLLQRPELRSRLGREWTKLHYQNHREDRAQQFVKEKVALLERLVEKGRYEHLILVGDPQRVAAVKRALPRKLHEMVVIADQVDQEASPEEVVAATMEHYLESEERDSRSLVDELLESVRSRGLAITGPARCLQVLGRGQADAMVISENFESDYAWCCDACGWAAVGPEAPVLCAECGGVVVEPKDAREELSRLAARSGCKVEVVGVGTLLDEFGAVGCLLRYQPWPD